MIDDNGEAILMDFGSTCKARIHVQTRQQALTQQVSYSTVNFDTSFNKLLILSDYGQDIAAEQSTMPYRAPELFDVKTGTTLDEKVDIWVRSLLAIRFFPRLA